MLSSRIMIHRFTPTPSDPLDPPEQPQPPEQNDGAGDVEENAPPSPQDETMRKARKDRAPNKKAIAIAEHVRKWLTEQVEQERKEFEAIWLGKGDVLSSSDDARNLTETIVAKTGFVVPRRGCEGMADCIHRASQGFRLDIQT